MRGACVCVLASVLDVSTAEYRGLVFPDLFFCFFLVSFALSISLTVRSIFLSPHSFYINHVIISLSFSFQFYINHAMVTPLYPFATSIQKKLYTCILYRIFTNNPYKFTHSFFLFLLIYSYSSSYSYYRFPQSSLLSSLSSFLHSLFFSLYFSSLRPFSFTFSPIFFVVQVFYKHRFLCRTVPILFLSELLSPISSL